MERDEKIKVAITAGIAGVILLILVLYLALSGGSSKDDEALLDENITEYASLLNSEEAGDSADLSSSQSSQDINSAEGASKGTSTALAGQTNTKASISGNCFYN